MVVGAAKIPIVTEYQTKACGLSNLEHDGPTVILLGVVTRGRPELVAFSKICPKITNLFAILDIVFF